MRRDTRRKVRRKRCARLTGTLPFVSEFAEACLRSIRRPRQAKRVTTATVDPIKPKGDAESFNHPSFAAHATTAGAVIDRKPATTPIPNARRNTCFIWSSAKFSLRLIVQPNQSGLFTELHDKQIVVFVFTNCDWCCDSEGFDQIGNRVGMTDDKRVSGLIM